MSVVIVTCNGTPFAGWKSVTVEQSFDKAAGQCQIKFSELPPKPMPMKMGDKVQVLIDGRSVIKGHIHDFNGSLDFQSHDLNAVIRDQTQDFIDSTVGPKLRLKPPITLPDMARRTLGEMGLGHIGVIDNVGEEPFKEGEQISAAIDDRGFAFIDKWAQKRQCLMNTDGNGNLCFDRNQKKRGPGRLVSMFEDSPYNNVQKSQFRNTDTDRHHATSVNGQKSTNDKDWFESKNKGFDPAQSNPLQKNWGTAYDTGVRPERRLHARGAKGLSGQSPKKAAKWRSSVARARGFQYTATVAGFYGAPGWLWWPGFIIPVIDPHWEIETELLIADVRFHKDWEGGEYTDVSCTVQDGFTTDSQGSAAEARTAKLGIGTQPPGAYYSEPDIDAGIYPEAD